METILNGIPEILEVSTKQNTYGVWTVGTLKVSAESISKLAEKIDEAMTKMEKILEKHNKNKRTPYP